MAAQSPNPSTTKVWYKKWWGKTVAILLFPLFIIWYAWAKSSWATPVRIVISIVGLGFVIMALATSHSTPTSVANSKPSSKPTETTTPPPITLSVDTKNKDTDELTAQIEKFFKDNNQQITNLEIANYDGGGYGVYIDYIGVPNVKATKYDMAQDYIAIHNTGKNVRAASLFESINAQDNYGNAKVAPYYKTLIDDPDWSNINWSAGEANLNQQILPGIWKVSLDYSSQTH